MRKTCLPVPTLVSRYKTGESSYRIGRAYGVDASTVRYHLVRAGVKMRPVGSRRAFGGPRTRQGRGYMLTKDGDGRRCRIHRACWEAYHGPIPEGHEVHHKNEDVTDNRVENLACMSKSEHTRLHKRRKRAMRLFVATLVVLALLVGACCGASQYRRFSAFNFAWTGGPLAPGDIVVVDVYVQGEGEDWVKVADDVPWPDVSIEFVWPDWANAPWPLPVDNSDERTRLDVQAMIDGEPYEYSCLMDWDAWNTISVECAAIEVPAP